MPNIVPSEETVLRLIFSPYHYSSKNKIKYQCLMPPKDTNEVSVNRQRLFDSDIEKRIIQEMSSDHKKIVGKLPITVKVINENQAEVIISPLFNNKSHADIIYNFEVKEGVPMPSDIKVIAKKILKESGPNFIVY
ncbi:hypothetical protein K5X82_07255 [Halosquirtibacter xylanolyticus]|uniref:hypothetical protein n=1 Tax=Halosquirtibacter xylanolyticus TaxID=3374599 RepID=UPI00374855F3|nr:hypothetical protein K5X82_07255 [Prolixibacteraceae bacterium]